MDMQYITHGLRGSQKPCLCVRARLSPCKDSDLYERWTSVLYTMSQKVAETVVARLQAEGYSVDDYKVHAFRLAIALSNGVSKGA